MDFSWKMLKRKAIEPDVKMISKRENLYPEPLLNQSSGVGVGEMEN